MVFTLREMFSMAEARNRRLTLLPVHRSLLLEADYPSPAALTLRSGHPGTAVVVNMPDEIDRPVGIAAIHPLPPLIRAACPGSPIWAATLAGNGGMTFLVDLYRLLVRQRQHRK